MTVCVALRVKHKNNKTTVIVAADSSVCLPPTEVYSTVDAKVFEYGAYTFAFAGDFLTGQVVKHRFIPPEPPEDPDDLTRFMAVTFVDKLRECFADAGLFTKEPDIKAQDTEFIVVVNKRLFWLGGDMSVLELTDNYIAIGAGKEYALGSLSSTANMKVLDRVEKAMKAAEAHCPWVSRPFHIVKVG